MEKKQKRNVPPTIQTLHARSTVFKEGQPRTLCIAFASTDGITPGEETESGVIFPIDGRCAICRVTCVCRP